MASLANTIHCSRNNLLKNLAFSGYDVSPFQDTDLSTIQTMYMNKNPNLLNMVIKKNEETRAFIQYFLHTGNPEKPLSAFKNNNLLDIIDNHKARTDYDGGAFNPEKDAIVVVIPNEVNDTVQKMITQVWEESAVFVVVFSLAELQFCVLEHKYVPKHEPLDNAEKAAIYKKYSIRNDSELPEIGRFDPAAKAVLLRPNQLCRIHRASRTAILDKNCYRLCI